MQVSQDKPVCPPESDSQNFTAKHKWVSVWPAHFYKKISVAFNQYYSDQSQREVKIA